MLRTIGFISLLTLAAPAMADGPNYNYIEGSYQRVTLDDGFIDVDGDGFGIGGSVGIGDNWQLIGGYNSTDFDFGVDLDQLLIGGGFHTALTPNTDFVANLAYIRLDASAFGQSFDDDGYAASVGVRSMVSDKFELAGFVQYADLSDSGNDTSVRGEAWYNFTQSFAVGLNVGTAEDVLTYGIGARVYFGN
jgi:hypothetical protein